MYSCRCNSRNLFRLGIISLNGPNSHTAFSMNCFPASNPATQSENGLTSIIIPVSQSRIRIPSFADSNSRLYRTSEAFSNSFACLCLFLNFCLFQRSGYSRAKTGQVSFHDIIFGAETHTLYGRFFATSACYNDKRNAKILLPFNILMAEGALKARHHISAKDNVPFLLFNGFYHCGSACHPFIYRIVSALFKLPD